MQTINFCGDSFCQLEPIVNNRSLSWTTLLASKLNVNIIGYGKAGAAYEHAIKTFDSTADYTIFCWTEPNRLYHAKYPLNVGLADVNSHTHPIYAEAKVYYKYLHNIDLACERQIRELYWFDHVILSTYQGLAIHLYCYDVRHTFTNGITINTTLDTRPMREILGIKNIKNEIHNHLTEQENSGLADKIYNIIKEHHEKTNYK